MYLLFLVYFICTLTKFWRFGSTYMVLDAKISETPLVKFYYCMKFEYFH